MAESGVVLGYAGCWSRPVQTGCNSGRDRVCVSMVVFACEYTRVRTPGEGCFSCTGAGPGQMPLSTR